MQGASLQCMQATEMDFSPGTPSFKVTTRRRFTPQGTSCSFLQAETQPLHSMQRSASQINFIRAMVLCPLDIADGRFGLLHHGDAVVAISGAGVDGLAAHYWGGAIGVIGQHVTALPTAREVKWHEHGVRPDT